MDASSHNREMLCLDQFCQSLIVRICFSGKCFCPVHLCSVLLFRFIQVSLHRMPYNILHFTSRTPSLTRSVSYIVLYILNDCYEIDLQIGCVHIYIYMFIALHAKPETKHETLTFDGRKQTTKKKNMNILHDITSSAKRKYQQSKYEDSRFLFVVCVVLFCFCWGFFN